MYGSANCSDITKSYLLIVLGYGRVPRMLQTLTGSLPCVRVTVQSELCGGLGEGFVSDWS